MAKKKVVYLFGAGATQAVLKSIDPGLSLLSKDIQDKISSKPSKSLDKMIWDQLITAPDIEHLISVLESQHHYFASEQIRQYYRNAIIDIIRKSPELKELPKKNLYSVLIDLHKNVGSSAFRVDEFNGKLTLKGLCCALRRDGFIVDTKTIATLNRLLKQPDLYERITRKHGGEAPSNDLKKRYEDNKKSPGEDNLFRLNRLALEEFYPLETPKRQDTAKLDEELLCFITLNYEDILERTITSSFGWDIDYSLHSDGPKPSANAIKVLKLHGSFSWQNTRPITITNMTSTRSSNALWIPPGVDKRKDNYPFNLLWGEAAENLMQCDKLRVIGCSLSRNDWGLIPLLYTVQRFYHTGKIIDIEIIDYTSATSSIINNYKYMTFLPISKMPEILNYYKNMFRSATSAKLAAEINAKFTDTDKSNPFQEWLDAKIDYLLQDPKMDLRTSHNFVHSFYYKT